MAIWNSQTYFIINEKTDKNSTNYVIITDSKLI